MGHVLGARRLFHDAYAYVIEINLSDDFWTVKLVQ